jgi:hypothetical protein
MNELILIALAAILALSAFYGGMYLIAHPQFDVELYVRDRIREYIESRTPEEILDFVSETETKLDNVAQPDSRDSASNEFPKADSASMEIKFDPFQVDRNAPQTLCDHSFVTCLDLDSTMVSNPLKKYLNDRMPIYIPADNATTRLWTGLYWNQWQWAYERWTTLQNVAELKSFEEANDIFLSHVFSLPENFQPKYSDDFMTIYAEQFLWDFLNGVRSDPPSCRFYRVNYASLESEAKTEKDTDWKSWVIHERSLHSNYSNILVPPMLNYLYPGCAVQAQYSEYHTVRVQMKGSARYLLMSPSQSSKMHLFPYTHPKSRLSQIDWFGTSENFADSGEGKYATALMVDAAPGDVVVVPPGWMVHTEAHNLSMFLDIHSPSYEQVKLLEAMSTRLPFPGSLKQDEKIIYAQVYLVHVLSRINGLVSIRGYATKLYNARYSFMFPEDSLFMQQHAFSCFADRPDYHQSVLDKMEKIRLQEFADFVAKKFNDDKISVPMRWLWLGNYVDSILRYAK